MGLFHKFTGDKSVDIAEQCNLTGGVHPSQSGQFEESGPLQSRVLHCCLFEVQIAPIFCMVRREQSASCFVWI